MEEETLLLQVAHRVANGGWRHAESEAPRQGPGPSRLSGLDVRADHGLEDPALAFGELV